MSAAQIHLVHEPAGAFSNVDRPEKVHVVRGVVEGDLRAPGPLLLAHGARVGGNIEARGAVHLARGAFVGGHVHAVGDVIVGAGATIVRGLRAEGKVTILTGASVSGEIDAASDVRLAPRCRVERLLVGGDLHITQPVLAPKVRVRGTVHVDPR